MRELQTSMALANSSMAMLITERLGRTSLLASSLADLGGHLG